jgi:hypothetical protein
MVELRRLLVGEDIVLKRIQSDIVGMIELLAE